MLTALGVAAIFADFRLPYTSTRFVGFAGAIETKMGIDLKGGVLAVFECAPQEDGSQVNDDTVNATVTRLLNSLSAAGLTEATVQRQGSNKIRVEVPGFDTTDEIFNAIGAPATIDFRADQSGTDKRVGANDIKKVSIYQNPQSFEWGILLTFTGEGGRKFREMIQEAGQGGNTYIFRNDQLYSTVTVQDTNAGANNTTVITLGKQNAVRADAEQFKLEIESGLYKLKLEISETSIIPQTLGGGALMGSMIALIIGIVFILGFMWLRYGDLGLLSNLSMIIYIVLFMTFLAIINAVQLTLPGIAGIILSLGMAVDANIIIFECMKDEYRAGKRLGVAVQNGFNKSILTIFDANITTIIGAVVLYLLGTGPIKGFAITLSLGVAISMFCSLIVTRSLAKLYLILNNNNANRLKLENNNKYITEVATAAAIPQKTQKRKLNFGEGVI